MTKALVDFVVGILGLPLKIVEAIIDLARQSNIRVSDSAVFALTIAVCLFIVAVPLIVDRGRSVVSRIVIAYGAFSLICMIGLQVWTNYFDFYTVKGSLSIKNVSSDNVSESFPASRLDSPSCDENRRASNQYCSNTIKTIAKADYSISSANCGSGIEAAVIDPQKQNCVSVQYHLLGCGYDRLPFGINNCRGRGWLEYHLTVYGSIPKTTSSDPASFSGVVATGRPLDVAPPKQQLGTGQSLSFYVSIHVPNKNDVVLTNERASVGDFSASILPNGSLRITYAKQTV